jgi:Heparinase II/III-like protein
MSRLPLRHRFEDSGVAFFRTSWEKDALAFAFKAGPPEGHRAARLLAQVPEWRPSTGHSHPDAGSFIVWAGGRLVVGDTGYAGKPLARHHNTVVIGEFGQGMEKEHDAWEGMDRAALDRVRITQATLTPASARIVADIAAAYPPAAGLTTLRREFTFEAPGRFRVRDQIETAEPRPAAWYLHADHPFAIDGTSFRDRPGDVLDGRAILPAGARLRTGPTILTAPGQPGSIEQGRPDQRGFEIVIEPPAASRATEFDVTFGVHR